MRHEFDRRTFLKIGGTGLAALASHPLFAGDIEDGNLPARTKPIDPIVLKSSAMEVVLDRKHGLPYDPMSISLYLARGCEAKISALRFCSPFVIRPTGTS
jgi:hypothetical protein